MPVETIEVFGTSLTCVTYDSALERVKNRRAIRVRRLCDRQTCTSSLQLPAGGFCARAGQVRSAAGRNPRRLATQLFGAGFHALEIFWDNDIPGVDVASELLEPGVKAAALIRLRHYYREKRSLKR
jgi:hypothetical protein